MSGMIAGVGAMILVGSSVAVIGGLDGLPAMWVQSFRYAVAAAVILVAARATGRRLVLPRGREVGFVVGGALLGMVGFNLALVLGAGHAEPAVFGAAVSCIPIALAIGGPLAYGRRPSVRLLAGAGAVAVGAVLVSGWGHSDGAGLVAAASLIGLDAGLTLLSAPVLPRLGPWTYSAATSAVAAAVFAVLGVIFEPAGLARMIEPSAIAAVLYLGAVATAISFVLWFSCVRRLGPGRAGLTAGIAAPASAVIGLALGGPVPGVLACSGMVVIMIGLLIGFGQSKRWPMPVESHRAGRSQVVVGEAVGQ
ncbi:MAG TPA: DMT family transporter [Microlunatus sp.]